MLGYIKSHSNYRIQERHQLVNNGVIFERDISTVGGANTFSRGVSTMYQSGNFVVLINTPSTASRHIRKGSWLASGHGTDIWDESILKNHSSDIYGSVEKSILPKNDFMDLRTFAYYGSLSSLVENTISKILTNFPYELYISKDSKVENVSIALPSGTCYNIENPGNIDIYNVNSLSNSTDDNLGHFYNGGKDNYGLYFGDDIEPISGDEFTWNVSEVIRYRCVVDNVDNINVGETYEINGYNWTICAIIDSDEKYVFLECFDSSYATINFFGKIGNTKYRDATRNEGPCKGMFFSKIIIGTNNCEYKIYALWDKDLNVKYVLNLDDDSVDVVPTHIRPRIDLPFYDDFIDSLDLFGKSLMGEFSGIRNTANFEILNDSSSAKNKTIQSFTFPTTNSGYNLESSGINMEKYVRTLGGIAINYDENYTDNFYRMITHDSLKNLDWTNGFNGEIGYDNYYVKTGKKFADIIRVLGYFFDEKKCYIDTIGYSNTVTYSNRDNLSDYFLTDSLETDGWVVNSTYPYDLREYYKDEDVTDDETIWCKEKQIENFYTRKFSEDTSYLVYPYYGGPNAYYEYCTGSNMARKYIPDSEYNGQKYEVVNGDVINVIKNYCGTQQLTIPTINNEFMKRLRVNSKNILKKKGTIESIESILSLFGMKSKRWVEASRNKNNSKYDFDVEEYTLFSTPIIDSFDYQHRMNKINWYNSCKTIPYQTESYINGEYIDYQGLPVAYRDVLIGNESIRKLYPYFSSNGLYDGDMYYQMNGGWMDYFPFRFDENDRILTGDMYNNNHIETLRNVGFVKNLNDLVSQPISNLSAGTRYYVTDISDIFALINGYPYKLKSTTISGETEYYFEVEVFDSSISVGGDLYEDVITVSDPNGVSGFTTYNLNIYSDGYPIRIYYTGDRLNAFTIINSSIYLSDSQENEPINTENGPETSYLYSGGCYSGESEYWSNYFELVDLTSCDRIGENYWRQIKKDERIFQILDSTVDKYNGNNPHSGNYEYDNGKEYINRFKQLFKYSYENRLFNESCFSDVDEAYEEIKGYGFKINDLLTVEEGITCQVSNDINNMFASSINNYMPQEINKYIKIPQEKSVCDSLRVFVASPIGSKNKIECKRVAGYYDLWEINYGNSSNNTFDIYVYHQNDAFNLNDVEILATTTKDNKVHAFVDRITSLGLDEYDIDSKNSLMKCGYGFVGLIEDADGVTSQIINTKQTKIRFYVDSLYSKESQEYIKYIQCKVMPYVEQMLASTLIVGVEFVPRNEDETCVDEPTPGDGDIDSPQNPDGQSSPSPDEQSSPSPESSPSEPDSPSTPLLSTPLSPSEIDSPNENQSDIETPQSPDEESSPSPESSPSETDSPNEMDMNENQSTE